MALTDQERHLAGRVITLDQQWVLAQRPDKLQVFRGVNQTCYEMIIL